MSASASASKGHLVIVRADDNGYYVSKGNVKDLGRLEKGPFPDAVQTAISGFTFTDLAGGKRSNALRSKARRTRSRTRRSKVGGKRSRARRTKSKRSKSTRRR